MKTNVHTNNVHIVDVLSIRSGYSSALLMFPYNYLLDYSLYFTIKK